MVCIGTATTATAPKYAHRVGWMLGGDYSALAATLIEQNDSEPLAAARFWVCRMAGKLETVEAATAMLLTGARVSGDACLARAGGEGAEGGEAQALLPGPGAATAENTALTAMSALDKDAASATRTTALACSIAFPPVGGRDE